MSSRIAVISDIHGNIWALESVLEDIQKRGIAYIVNLGDSLYGPLEPGSMAKLLMNEKIISISGNQDRVILESIGRTDIHHTMKFVIEHLDNQSVEWLKTLSSTCEFSEVFFSVTVHQRPMTNICLKEYRLPMSVYGRIMSCRRSLWE